jgi:Starch-binding associating with outer membrane
MFTVNKLTGVLFITCLLFGLSCSKNKFLDINDNPNNPTTVPPKVLLPTTTIGIAFTNGNELGRVASLLMQHNAGVANQAGGFDIYNLDGSFDNAWDFEIYSNCVSDLRSLIASTETTSPVYAGIAKIQLAYIFSLATDLWGDVPYSEAGFGLKSINPRFDLQQDIYQGNAAKGITSLFDLVKSGLADLDKTGALAPTTDDLVYGGNTANWKRAGNTLLLKFAIQISNANSTLAKTIIDQVITGNNFITSNAQDFEVPFGANVGSQSPIFSFNNVNRVTDQMLSTRFLALMTAQNDLVRLSKLYTSPTGTFVGYENGNVIVPPPAATRSKYNSFVTGPDATGRYLIRLVSNSQRAFLLSEAALVLGTAGDANALYQEGIRAHMTKCGMTIAEIDAYFTANPAIVTLTGSTEEKLKQIITQKYISFVTNPLEAYNDYRRTGYPSLQVALNSAGDDPTTIPKRYPYTPNERARNPNAPKPRPLMNVKVWWGK